MTRDELRSSLTGVPAMNAPTTRARDIACPSCGGSQTTWKCTCAPIWPGYASREHDALSHLTDAQALATWERMKAVRKAYVAAILAKVAHD